MTLKELEPCSPLSQCFGKTPKCKRECEEDSCRIVPVPKCQDVEDTVSHFFITYLTKIVKMKGIMNIFFFCTVHYLKSPKMSWHFPLNFVQQKLTCLVTLFDRKLQFSTN